MNFRFIGQVLLTNVLLLILTGFVSAQDAEFENYQLQKEKILQVIINTTHFDSIYSAKRVYLEENELLSTDTKIGRTKKGKKVKILSEEELKRKNLPFINLASFRMARDNPETAGVQVYSSLTKLTMNLFLVKKGVDWIIHNYKIFE